MGDGIDIKAEKNAIYQELAKNPELIDIFQSKGFSYLLMNDGEQIETQASHIFYYRGSNTKVLDAANGSKVAQLFIDNGLTVTDTNGNPVINLGDPMISHSTFTHHFFETEDIRQIGKLMGFEKIDDYCSNKTYLFDKHGRIAKALGIGQSADHQASAES